MILSLRTRKTSVTGHTLVDSTGKYCVGKSLKGNQRRLLIPLFAGLLTNYPSSVVDGVVGIRINPQKLTRREICDIGDNFIIVVHL